MDPVVTEVGLDAFPFHVHWDIVGLIAALVVGYVFGVRRLAAEHAPASEPAVTRGNIAWFATGLFLFAAVEMWPVHDIAEGSLFSFHMSEHVVLAMLVPPLLMLGIPSWLMRLVVRPILPLLRVITRPIVALIVFNTVLALIHVPAVLETMLDSEAAHLGWHVGLILAASIMWWPVLGPIPDLPRLAPFMAMGYLFLQSLVPTIPASFLTFASEPLYEIYETFPRLWGLDALTDQRISGLIMKVGGGAILWTAITIIFFRWARDEEKARDIARSGASR